MEDKKRVLVTGGAGFIGSTLINKILNSTKSIVYNLDYLNYASDLSSITKNFNSTNRHTHLNVNLEDINQLESAIELAKPDIIYHLAAESHVDRSISNPLNFIKSNVLGTFNLLESARKYWEGLTSERKEIFKIIHISTDEVFGSVEGNSLFNENSNYDPKSPYSASKASSDHLMKAWFNTYGLPIIVTNCTNNYGPYQFPEKLIPFTFFNALKQKPILLYGDGKNIRDWLHVDDHVEALLLVGEKGELGESYCIGGGNEKKNIDVVNQICDLLDLLKPINMSYSKLITFVKDRPGHDKRYAIDSRKLKIKIGWEPKFSFEEGLKSTIHWYFDNQDWVKGKMENLLGN